MQKILVSYQENSYFNIEKSTDIMHIEQDNIIILLSTTSSRNTIETLLLAYQTEGMHFLKKVEDTFSLFIYDKNKNKIFIAKDKVGVQPLYFTQYDQTVIVATHLKAFQEISTFKANINSNAIANYMQYGMILQPHTIFENTHKVKSGHYVEFDLKNNTHNSHAYWKLEDCYSEKKSLFNEQEIIKTSHKLLNESLHKKMSNHKTNGFSLSGGYDSSTLVALAQANSQQKINTFTIGFEDKEINEAAEAKKIAKHLGTNHTEHYFTAQDAVEIIPSIAKIYDEPFADHAVAPTILTSQLLKQAKIENLISGDGGDEVFATADDLSTFNLLQKTPKFLKQVVASSLNKLPHSQKLKNKQQKLAQILLQKNIAGIIKVRKGLFLEQELELVIKNLKPKIETSFDDIAFTENTQTLDQIIGTYFKTTMTDGELVKSYTSMNNMNISLSVPFLDAKLIEYLAKVPSDIKVKNNVKKYLLKEIAQQYLPKSLMERPKSGFDVPYSSWMRNELKDILHNQINKERLEKDNIFHTSAILHIRDKFYTGDNSYKNKLWRIFIFQLWYGNFTN